MRAEEVRAVLALCVLASFADGDKHEREREEIRRVAEGFSESDAVHLSVLRALRVLRVLRVLTIVPSMRRVVGGLLAALPGLSSIAVVLLLVY